MRIYTAHLRDGRGPVLVPEAFSWGGLFFGPLWLLRHGSWIAAVASTLVLVAICTLLPPSLRPILSFGVLLLTGFVGHDLRRWHLSQRRYKFAHVVAGNSRDDAYFRLMSARPDQARFA